MTEPIIQAQQIQFLKLKLNKILVSHTGQTLEKIEGDTDRDNYMSAEDAKEYGIVDTVVVSRAGKTEDKKSGK